MKTKISEETSERTSVTFDPEKDRAFVRLASAILEEPEEVVLAALLAKRQKAASVVTH